MNGQRLEAGQQQSASPHQASDLEWGAGYWPALPRQRRRPDPGPDGPVNALDPAQHGPAQHDPAGWRELSDCWPDGLLDALRDNVDAGIAVVDEQHRLLRSNAPASALLQRFEVGRGDQLSRVRAQAFAADGSTPISPGRGPLERALSGEPVHRETLVLRYEGIDSPHRMVMSAIPIQLVDGTRGVVTIWHDISESWLSGERARAELARLSELLEGASDYAIFMLDPSGRVTTWSDTAVRVFGRSEQETLGSSYVTFFTEPDRAAGVPERLLAEAARTGRARSEGSRVRGDGTTFWAQGVITATTDPDGGLRGFVKVTHDVTEQRAAEQAIEALNQELRQLNGELERRVAARTTELQQQQADMAATVAELEAFSYSVSHDLRAPLRAMSGFARILEDEYAALLPAEAIRYLHKVQENATQMGSLIDALLAFSRMQRLSMAPEPLDMRALVNGSWTALATERHDRQIDFVVAELPWAIGDRRLIQQVWTNLLDNAIKYTGPRERARIEVSAEIADGMVTYTVQDNGVGFDMRYVDKVGQVFQRLHRSEDFSGVGIGLALVQRIVQRHGGRMIVAGEPDRGARIGFSLREAS